MEHRYTTAPCVWKELTLRWEGLGDQRQLTTTENFNNARGEAANAGPKSFPRPTSAKEQATSRHLGVRRLGKERRIQTSNAGLAAFCSSVVTSKANSKLLNKAHLRHPIAFIPAGP